MPEDLQWGGAGRWDGAVLAPVAEINEHLLDALHRAATGPACVGQRLINALRPQWDGLAPGVLHRLAHCPYLLLDAGFCDVARWLSLQRAGVMDQPVESGYFTTPDGVMLVRRALLFAWHMARANPLTARIVLGMSAGCAACIAASRLRDLEALAERCPGWIRPRWDNQPRVWQHFIAAAQRNSPGGLRQAQLRGLQLLAAACAGTH